MHIATFLGRPPNQLATTMPSVTVFPRWASAGTGMGPTGVNGVTLTETQAAERLQEKLHDGYRRRSNCVYVNMTPMHVSFSVIFGLDGLVTEVTPVHRGN
jgi:hypothetical protein